MARRLGAIDGNIAIAARGGSVCGTLYTDHAEKSRSAANEATEAEDGEEDSSDADFVSVYV